MAQEIVGLVHALAEISAAPSYKGDNLFVDTEPVRRLSRDDVNRALALGGRPASTLRGQMELAQTILAALGYGGRHFALVEASDAAGVAAAFAQLAPATAVPTPRRPWPRRCW